MKAVEDRVQEAFGPLKLLLGPRAVQDLLAQEIIDGVQLPGTLRDHLFKLLAVRSQLLLGPLAPADVAQHADGMPFSLQLQGRKGKLERELGAVFSHCGQLERPADARALTGSLEPADAAPVLLKMPPGGKQRMQFFSDRFVCRVAEDHFRGGVPERYDPLMVHHDDGILCRRGNGVQGLVAFPEGLEGQVAFPHGPEKKDADDEESGDDEQTEMKLLRRASEEQEVRKSAVLKSVCLGSRISRPEDKGCKERDSYGRTFMVHGRQLIIVNHKNAISIPLYDPLNINKLRIICDQSREKYCSYG